MNLRELTNSELEAVSGGGRRHRSSLRTGDIKNTKTVNVGVIAGHSEGTINQVGNNTGLIVQTGENEF